MWLTLIFNWKNITSFGKSDSWRKWMFNEYLLCDNYCSKYSSWITSFKSRSDPKILVCWKQATLQCHSLPHPKAHLCHYQNKETFASCQRLPLILLVMTRDFFPQRCLQHGDKEMSPFILEENVLYKLPLTCLSLRQAESSNSSQNSQNGRAAAPLHTAARVTSREMKSKCLEV